ncbi:2-oxoglutarate dehydrogenase-like, mitochondrial [Paramuricea clavata]|uniref:2-oxoglutarate dehydrogenase, mitochondrial n=1 Tax=Paramuricea clavata TaxID=317549 RepID=A0A6S7IG51_PARCT|nr:2-oxoglutarate dehydrogenase-like, mitochondrial [Paramuricea clavata]CAB4015930.1 2-oxoglutarate dehydrogenase-like, mitochondrial [Paramuricea clavata]
MYRTHKLKYFYRNLWRNQALRLCVKQQRTLASEPFANGTNNNYLEDMYRSWQKDPNSVHSSWQSYFKNIENGARPGEAYTPPPSLASGDNAASLRESLGSSDVIPSVGGELPNHELIQKHLAVYSLIRSYQIRGNNVADLDPLGILDADLDSSIPPELSMGYWLYNTLRGDPPPKLTTKDFEEISKFSSLYLRLGVGLGLEVGLESGIRLILLFG